MIRLEASVRQFLVLLGILAAAVAGGLLGLWLLIQLWPVLLLASCGLLIAAALMPYVDWLWRRTHNRALAVLLVVTAVLAAVALLILSVVPPMVRQAQDLWERAPELQAEAAAFEWQRVRERGQRHLVTAGQAAVRIVVSLVTVFVLAAYFLLDAPRLKRFLYVSTPRPWHPHIRALLPAL